MKRAIGVLVIFLISAAARGSAQDVIFIVRHAERADASADPSLSAEGRERAGRLAQLLKDSAITRIYTTDLKRTVETAAPTAAALHVVPDALPAADMAGLIKRLGGPGRILVVGHSNTIPDILASLGAPAPVVIADGDYDNLFIVLTRTGAPPQIVRLRY